MMWLYEIYEASRCLCHTERLGLDHWISREGGLLLPRWSTLRTSWMTRSCRRPTTGAQNGICIMTTTITNVTTVSTISLLIMPYSVGLVPAHVTQIVRSPAENGSPWLSQVFHRWGCCVAFHQALLSLHSALGLKNIWKTWAHFLSNGLLAAFFGVWGVWECSGSSIWDNMVTLLLCKGRKRVLKWTAQRCATMTPFTALHPFVDLGHLVWNCQERCWTQLFCLWVEELKGFAGFAQSFLLGHGRTRDSNNLFKSLLNLITNILWFNMLQISPIVTAPSQNNPLANWPIVLLSGIGWVGFLNMAWGESCTSAHLCHLIFGLGDWWAQPWYVAVPASWLQQELVGRFFCFQCLDFRHFPRHDSGFTFADAAGRRARGSSREFSSAMNRTPKRLSSTSEVLDCISWTWCKDPFLELNSLVSSGRFAHSNLWAHCRQVHLPGLWMLATARPASPGGLHSSVESKADCCSQAIGDGQGLVG